MVESQSYIGTIGYELVLITETAVLWPRNVTFNSVYIYCNSVYHNLFVK